MEEPTDVWTWNPPHAVVQQIGRWKHQVYVSHGFLRIDGEFGTYRYGRERAEKKGRKMLAEYLLDRQRRENVTEIYP
jgi:hypothetical protein